MATRLIEEAGDKLGQLDTLTGYHLRRSSAVFGAAFATAVAGSGLRQIPFAILSVVAASPGIKQGAAGHRLGIQRANMVALVNELVEGDYIDRRAAEDDRRAFALHVTSKGAETLDRLTAAIHHRESELLADFTASERGALLALLRRIEAREAPAPE